jgi:hypothetical protein
MENGRWGNFLIGGRFGDLVHALIQVDASVGEFSKRSLLLELGRLIGVLGGEV